MSDDLDPRVSSRVRQLLAKAAHPSTPVAEAEAFSLNAASLIARHLVDCALLDARRPTYLRPRPEVRPLDVPPPYALARTHLLAAVGRAHRVVVVAGRGKSAAGRGSLSPDRGAASAGRRRATLVGFPADLSATELLFASLSTQAESAMLAASREAPGPRTFRRAFLIGYAATIGARLARINYQAEARATATSTSAERILADRVAAVHALTRATFPRLRSLHSTAGEPARVGERTTMRQLEPTG